MALSGLSSQPSQFTATTQKLDLNHHETSNKNLPVPLEINLAGRNLKISDYNELISLNNINSNCRRINTLTIRTVSTYKKKTNLLSNDESTLQVCSKSDEVNKTNSIDESKFKQIENSNVTVFRTENSKLNNQKSVYRHNKESAASSNINLTNSFHSDLPKLNDQINKSCVKTKVNTCVNEVNFLRNIKSTSSLKRQSPFSNQVGKNLSTLKSDDQKQATSNDNKIESINLNKNKMFKNYETDFNLKSNNQNPSAISNQHMSNDKNLKKEFFNSSMENILSNSFNNSYNSNQLNSRINFKDGNNNSNLKANISNRFLQSQYVSKNPTSNAFSSNSLTRRSIKKLSGEEINCDEFVSELKDRIANNNLQATSSPAIQLKSNVFHSNETILKKDKRQLIFDTSTMPNSRNVKPSSTLMRNESFQKATETQFKYISQAQRKHVNTKNEQLNNDVNKSVVDSETLSKRILPERYNYGSSQVANGYCPSSNMNEITNELNDLRLNDTTCTTEDWNTTLETANAETRSVGEDTLRKKKCDKYGFFINDDQTSNDQIKNIHNKRLKNEIEKRREMKWLDMLNNWDKYMQKKWHKICNRCRKGIPVSLRGTAWFYLCAAHKQKKLKPEIFKLLDQQIGNESVNDEITKDLHRQFPNHEMFAGTNTIGQQDLFKVLKCFSIVKPEIAYCQGQAPLASVLLMHLPVEDAFWCLIQLSDYYLPGYFSPGLETIQMHGQMLNSFLKRYNNNVYKILKKQKIDPNFYMTEWFMCLFSRTLSWPTVLRVWDMFFCEGIKIIFRVALVILCSLEPDFKKAKCKSNDKLGETLAILKNLPKKYLTEEFLLPKVMEMNLSEKDLENEHLIIMKKMKKQKKESKK